MRSFAVAVAFLFIAASLRRSVEVCDNIADNLRKAVEVGAVSQRLIITGEQSGLQTLIAATVNAPLCKADEKLTAFLSKASLRRLDWSFSSPQQRSFN